MYRKIILTLSCLLISSTTVFAGLEEGLKFYMQKKYDQAFEEFSYLADEGNNIAAYHLGLMYEGGLGVPQSNLKAAEYYLKSYQLGNTTAASKLGVLLIKGDGIEQNKEQGLELLKTAGRAGDKEALYQLGEIYVEGKDVPKEYVYAAGFYKMAALQGYAPAQHKLGLLYLLGRGIPQDLSLAFKWLARAANQGYVAAQHDIAELRTKSTTLSNPVEAYMWYNIIAAYNSNEIGEWAMAQRNELINKIQNKKNMEIAMDMSRKWKPITAEETVPESELLEPTPIIPGFNDVDTLRQLQERNAIILSDGSPYGIRTEELETAILNKNTIGIESKISELGDNGRPDAYTFWGKIVENRLQDPKNAVKWYKKGAQKGDVEAQYKMAQLYCEGKEVPLEPTTCYMWLQIAIKKAQSPFKELVTEAIKELDSRLSDAEKAEGLKKAETWFTQKSSKKTGFKLF